MHIVLRVFIISHRQVLLEKLFLRYFYTMQGMDWWFIGLGDVKPSLSDNCP